MTSSKKVCWLFVLLCWLSSTCGKDQNSSDNVLSKERSPRIVTLTPSATGILVALGQQNSIVGRDRYSVEPEKLRELPVVGDFANPNIEAILALQPDLVVLDESQKSTENALKTLDINTLPLRMHQLSDVRTGLIEVGKSLNLKREADATIKAIEADIAKIRKLGLARNKKPSVLVLIDRDPDTLRNLFAAGPNTYVDELLSIVGARNVMSGAAMQYPQIGAEQILRAQPDIILDLSKSPNGLAAYDVVAEVPAVINQRVHLIDNGILLSPSPRVGEALKLLYSLTE